MNMRGILAEDEVFALLNATVVNTAAGTDEEHYSDAIKKLAKSHERLRNELLRVTEKVAVAHLALSNILNGSHQPEPPEPPEPRKKS